MERLSLEDKKHMRKNYGRRTITFRCPIKALEFGFDNDANVEISVEYEKHLVEVENLIVNVWVMETDINVKSHVTSLYVPVEENEPPLDEASRILSILDKSETFREQLFKAITVLRENDFEGMFEAAHPKK
jgi:hypothetical protein